MISKKISLKNLLEYGTVYLILLLFVTWPGIIDPARLASPPEGDRGANVWNLWWTAHCLETGNDPRWTPLIFHPEGCSLIHHSLSLSNGLVLAPLTLILGPATTYGAAFFLWSLLTGVGGMVWSKRWLNKPGEQWLVGFFLVFSAYRFAHLDHLNLFSTAGIPWSFWAFDQLRENRRWKASFLCAFLWTLTTFSCWYYGVVVGMYALCRFLGTLCCDHARRGLLLFLLPFVAVAALVWGYIYIPISGASIKPDTIPIETVVYWSLPIDNLLRPSWLCPSWVRPEFRLHPGVVFLLLAAIELARRYRNHVRMPFLLWVAILYALLSLGPILQYRFSVLPIILPGYFFLFLPGLNQVKVFARFLYPSMICLAPLVALGLGRVTDRITAKTSPLLSNVVRTLIFVIVIFAFWFEQNLPPFGPWTGQRPKTWTPNARIVKTIRETDGSVLELPFTPSTLVGMHLARQTQHGKPLIIGEVSRLQKYRELFLARFPSLLKLNTLVKDPRPWSREAILQVTQLFEKDQKELGIGTIVVTERYCKHDPEQQLSLFLENLSLEIRPRLVMDTSRSVAVQ